MRVVSLICLFATSCFAVSSFAQTLDDTISSAISYHPELEEARLEIALAEEQNLSAQALKGLSVSLGGAVFAQSQDSNRAFSFDLGETLVSQAQLDATYPLYTSGEIPASQAQAEFYLEAAKAAFESKRQEVLANAIEAHLELSRASQQVRIRERNTERLSQQYAASEERFEVGVLTRTDVALSQARNQAAIAGLALAQAEYDTAQSRYAELTGMEAQLPVTPTESLEIPESLDQAFALLRLENPGLRQLRSLERVQEQAKRAARSQRKTKLEAFGTATVQDGRWDNDFRDTGATIGLRVSRSLYSNGRLLSDERQAGLELQKARMRTRAAENALIAQLSSVWAQEIAANRAVAAAEKEVEAARTALEGAEIEVGVGLRTVLDFLDQEQDLLDAELRLIEARKNVYMARSQILAFLGELGASETSD